MSEHDTKSQATLSEQSVSGAAGYLFAGTAISKVAGFARDVMTASLFGAGTGMDSFFVAQSISSILGNASGSGIATAFLPVFARKRQETGIDGCRQLTRATLIISFAFSIVLMLVVVVGAKPLVRLLAPDLASETFESTVSMARTLSLLIVGYLLYYLVSGIYHAMNHFVVPSFSQVVENIIVIALLFFLGSAMGIDALILASILGVYGLLAVLIIPLTKNGGFAGKGAISGSGAGGVFYASLPLMGIFLSFQGYFMVERYFASGLDEGSIASIAYARRIIDLPNVFFVTTLTAATFPRLSSLYAKSRLDDMSTLLYDASAKLVFVLVPATMVLLLWPEKIVALVFQRGAFGTDAARLTSTALFYYSMGLLPIAGSAVTGRALYAAGSTKIPFIVSLLGIGTNIIANTILVPRLGIAGIALSTTLMMYTICMLQAYYIYKKQIDLRLLKLARVLTAAILCSLVSILIVVLLEKTFMKNTVLSMVSFLLLYCIASLFYCKEQVREILDFVRTKLGRN